MEQNNIKKISNGIGEVVEWSITAVLKTVELKGSGGSNPSLSAKGCRKVAELARAAFFVSFCHAPPQAGGDVRPTGANPSERE